MRDNEQTSTEREVLARLLKPQPQRHVLCVILGVYGDAIILFSGDREIHDYVREGGQLASDNGLDDPPSKGIWIWEGSHVAPIRAMPHITHAAVASTYAIVRARS